MKRRLNFSINCKEPSNCSINPNLWIFKRFKSLVIVVNVMNYKVTQIITTIRTEEDLLELSPKHITVKMLMIYKASLL